MRMWTQIFVGSIILLVTAIVHIVILATTIGWLERASAAGSISGAVTVSFLGFGAILLGHTVQIWLWALSLNVMGALSKIDDAVYFALVTTTTLGYGDVTLSRSFRILGAMGAVSGLLTFGLSTAFLLGLFQEIVMAH